MILGKNLIVSLDGVAVAGAKSCQLEMTRQFLQTCSPTESQVLEKVPTLYDWSVSCDGLIPASSLTSGLEDKLIAGTKCLLTFTDGSGQNRAGFVYVKSCKESGSVGSLATFSASFESTGALYKITEYTASSFTYGSDLEIRVTDSSVIFGFQPSGTSTKGVQITVDKNGYMMVLANDSWVLEKLTLAQVNDYIDHEDDQTLTAWIVEDGYSSKIFPILAGTYTYLVDDHSTSKKIRLLQ